MDETWALRFMEEPAANPIAAADMADVFDGGGPVKIEAVLAVGVAGLRVGRDRATDCVVVQGHDQGQGWKCRQLNARGNTVAAEGLLQPGDTLVAVQGQSVEGLSFSNATAIMSSCQRPMTLVFVRPDSSVSLQPLAGGPHRGRSGSGAATETDSASRPEMRVTQEAPAVAPAVARAAATGRRKPAGLRLELSQEDGHGGADPHPFTPRSGQAEKLPFSEEGTLASLARPEQELPTPSAPAPAPVPTPAPAPAPAPAPRPLAPAQGQGAAPGANANAKLQEWVALKATGAPSIVIQTKMKMQGFSPSEIQGVVSGAFS
jgi:hypothetical protein